ncbi:MAG: hypothetical protein R3B06_05030 [Kofleriaceae bacterium]
MTNEATSTADVRDPELLRTKVEDRAAKLRGVLAAEPSVSGETRKDIEAALAAVATLTTGDLDNIPDSVGHRLTDWLRTSKDLGKRAEVTGPPVGA